MGGFSTAGVMVRQKRMPPNLIGPECGCLAAPPLPPRDTQQGETQLNSTDKLMPIASIPDNRSTFNGHEVLPWRIYRADARATLRRARCLRARGKATVNVEAVGRYGLSTVNTIILNTKRSGRLAGQASTVARHCRTASARLLVRMRAVC